MSVSVRCRCGETVSIQGGEAAGTCPACGARVRRKLKVAEAIEAPSQPSSKPPVAKADTGPTIIVDRPVATAKRKRGIQAGMLIAVAAGLAGCVVLACAAVGAMWWLQSDPASEEAIASAPSEPPPAPTIATTELPNVLPDDTPELLTPPMGPPAVDAPTVPDPPLEKIELGEAVTVHGIYSVQPPQGFMPHEPEHFGTPDRWAIRQRWQSSSDPPCVFEVTVERDDEYSMGRLPRVSSRVLPPGNHPPIVRHNGAYVVQGAIVDELIMDGLSFVRADSDADRPPAVANAVLYAAYDQDRLIRISGWQPDKDSSDRIGRNRSGTLGCWWLGGCVPFQSV